MSIDPKKITDELLEMGFKAYMKAQKNADKNDAKETSIADLFKAPAKKTQSPGETPLSLTDSLMKLGNELFDSIANKEESVTADTPNVELSEQLSHAKNRLRYLEQLGQVESKLRDLDKYYHLNEAGEEAAADIRETLKNITFSESGNSGVSIEAATERVSDIVYSRNAICKADTNTQSKELLATLAQCIKRGYNKARIIEIGFPLSAPETEYFAFTLRNVEEQLKAFLAVSVPEAEPKLEALLWIEAARLAHEKNGLDKAPSQVSVFVEGALQLSQFDGIEVDAARAQLIEHGYGESYTGLHTAHRIRTG